MAYERTSWHDGDLVTAAKLNNIEQGIEDLSIEEGTADTLINGATVNDAGKVLSIDDNGDAALIPGAEIYGSPLVANSASDMVNTTRVYVYTGNETGYINGNWYYHDGSNWMSGGTYNSQSGVTNTIEENSNRLPTSAAVYDAINAKFQNLIDAMYPIGSLYFTTNNENPSTYLGGYWVRYAEGKTIFGISATDEDFGGGANGKLTGGRKKTSYAVGGTIDHNHEAGTSNPYPANRYIFSSDSLSVRGGDLYGQGTGSYLFPAVKKDRENDVSTYDGFASTLYTNNNFGGLVQEQGHVFTATNLPPYVSCYIWQRVESEPSSVVTSVEEPYPIENVPSYFRTRVLEVTNQLNNDFDSSWAHSIFITDIHANWNPSSKSNQNHSQSIAMYLTSHTPIDKIILGGDYCEDWWDQRSYDFYAKEFVNAGYGKYVYPVIGNHERFLKQTLSRDSSEHPDSSYAAAQARASICNDFLLNKTNIAGDIHAGYYYVDDTTRKIRYAFLNTSDAARYAMSYRQLRWIKDNVLARGTDWTLLTFGHINIDTVNIGGATDINTPANLRDSATVRNLLAQWKGPNAGYICGHYHVDSTSTLAAGFQQTSLYCDTCKVAHTDTNHPNFRPPQVTPGTYTEHAVTVVSIRPTTKLVALKRIGAGGGRLGHTVNSEQTIRYNYT